MIRNGRKTLTTDNKIVALPASESRGRLESFVELLMPSVLLTGSGYEAVWQAQKRIRDARILTYSCVIAAIAFVVQLAVVDLQIPLNPTEFWVEFRLGTAGALLAIATVLFFTRSRFVTTLKVLFAATAVATALLQAQGMVFEPGVPLIFAIILGAAVGIVTPIGIIPGLLLTVVTALGQRHILAERMAESADFAAQFGSMYLAAIAILFVTKIMQAGQVTRFLADMREIERQRQVIALQSDLVNQLRSFLPRVVFERINHYKRQFRTTFEYATQEILRPRSVDVACIWSDIRHFTHSSRDLGYIDHKAGPNLRHLTEISESCGAIPRVIGDLLLCIFDYPEATTSILQSLTNADSLREANSTHNQLGAPDERIDRVFILSFGRAVVGNVGGSSGSREITALGPSVNQLARLDEAIGNMFRHGDEQLRNEIIATTEFVTKARSLGFIIDTARIDLQAMGVSVRDFPEITSVERVVRWQFIEGVATESVAPPSEPKFSIDVTKAAGKYPFAA